MDVRSDSEDALGPDIPIVDAHHHLMDRPGVRYLLDDLLVDISRGHRIVSTVYIESRSMLRANGPESLKPVGETEFANGVAAMSASGQYGPSRVCSAIVSYADLTMGAAVEEVLDAHEASGGGRFRGIRQGTYWDADDEVWQHGVTMRPPSGMLLDPKFREGLAVLTRKGLSFDAALFHPQLPELTSLARKFMDTPIVLNHMGFPLGVGHYRDHRDEVFEIWRSSMRDLATAENVMVKLGGCGITLWGFGFEARDKKPSSVELASVWRPYIETCIELFGVDRCMFESNFPADRPSSGYVEIWNALKRISADATASERTALFSGTATRAYRLSVPLETV